MTLQKRDSFDFHVFDFPFFCVGAFLPVFVSITEKCLKITKRAAVKFFFTRSNKCFNKVSCLK